MFQRIKNGRFFTLVLLTMFALIVSPFLSYTSAKAATPPPYTTSRYMSTASTSTLYNEGCSLGTADKNAGATYDNVVVLDFGEPMYSGGVYGMYLYNSTFQSLSTIQSAVEQFAQGFWDCTGSNLSTLLVVMGTSNYGSYVSTGHATAFANTVNSIMSWLTSKGYTNYIKAAGGSDMETEWGGPSTTRAWADAYNSAHQYPLYDYGDAGGCPAYSQGTCNGGWTTGDVYHVSWGIAAGYALPEIYNTSGTNAYQWQQISLYGPLNGTAQGKITFSGEMTQYQACSGGGCSGTNNTPSAGWTQLYNAVNSDSRTAQSGLEWSTDISWAN